MMANRHLHAACLSWLLLVSGGLWAAEQPEEIVMFQAPSSLVVIATIGASETIAQDDLNRRTPLEVLEVLVGKEFTGDAQRRQKRLYLAYVFQDGGAAGDAWPDCLKGVPPKEGETVLLILHPQYDVGKKVDSPDYGTCIVPFGGGKDSCGYGCIRLGTPDAVGLAAFKADLTKLRARLAQARTKVADVPDIAAMADKLASYYDKTLRFAQKRVEKAEKAAKAAK